MHIPKPFVEEGIKVLDLIHRESGQLIEGQRWNIREVMRSLLKKQTVTCFVDQVRGLAMAVPKGEIRNQQSCYGLIPPLAAAMRRLHVEIPPPGPALVRQILPDDIARLKGRIEGLIQVLGKEPYHETEEPDEGSGSRPLSERDVRDLVAEIRIRRTNTETPRARHNKGSGPRLR